MVDPLVNHDVINGRSLGWVVVKYLSDQITSTVCNGDVIGEVIRIHSNPLVSCLDVRCLKRGLADNKRVDYHTNGPDVDLVRMTLLAFEDLRCDIVGSTANRALPLTVELELGSETEITYFDFHLVVKEQVTELQISMDDAMTVEVLDGSADLVDVALDFEFVESLTSTQELIQRLILAELEEDVNILGVLEEVLETYDVVLMKRAMNLDLGHELLLGASLGECAFHDDLSGTDPFIFKVSELEAASETSLSEELALQVLLDADLAVIFDDFLFYDGLGTVDTFFGMTLLHLMIIFVFLSYYT